MLIKKIFITGGAGFIGSHICEEVYKKFPKSKIIIFDKLTYAGNKKYLENIIKSSRVKFVRGDIIKHYTYSTLLKNVDLAINVAAESHVDNSFISPHSFSILESEIEGGTSSSPSTRPQSSHTYSPYVLSRVMERLPQSLHLTLIVVSFSLLILIRSLTSAT